MRIHTIAFALLQEFRDWIKATYPFIIVLFVPANCPGIFQPCDVGLQRLFKHSEKQSASQFFVKHIQNERLKGVMPGKIRLPTKLAELQDQTPTWYVKRVDFLNSTSDDNVESLGLEVAHGKIVKPDLGISLMSVSLLQQL